MLEPAQNMEIYLVEDNFCTYTRKHTEQLHIHRHDLAKYMPNLSQLIRDLKQPVASTPCL